MLTVMELLSFPLFRGFRLASGYSGLYNQVTGTGIFEWESSYEVEKNFEQGEFVVTTLSLARGDRALAESSIRMLLDKRVSAIAVKEVYFHEFSDELKAYSDTTHIPIFFFSDIFFDDIIFTIKNTLLTQRRDFIHDELVEFLLDASRSAEQKKRKALEINPFFHSGLICCFADHKGRWHKQFKSLPLDPARTVFSLLEYRRGILVIYTEKDSESSMEARLLSFLQKTGLKQNMNSIGISSAMKGLENIGTAIQESLYAHSSCRLDRLDAITFSDTGLDQLLLPMSANPWAKTYHDKLVKRLMDYDETHSAKLMETLLVYTENDGDIKATAQKLYQHGNTIRYRIDKIRALLGIKENGAAFAQFYAFVRLHEIYRSTDSGNQ